MAKTKASVTLDPQKVARAKEIIGAASLSELIDVALARLIDSELERRHIAGYLRQPPGAAEDGWADAERAPADIDDDVDWAALYGEARP